MLIEKTGVGYAGYRIPGIVLTEKNTLLAYYECRKESISDWAQIDIKIIRSDDFGDTWETVDIIQGDTNTLNNPVMIVNKDKIHFLFCKNYKQLFYTFSIDDGKTFAQPKEISEVFEKSERFYNVAAIGPGHGIVYNERLIIPAWFAYNGEQPKAHRPSFIRTIYSDDDGLSWKLGDIIGNDELVNPSESALAETPNGNVLISIRNENQEKMRALAFSATGIDGWTVPYLENNLPDPVCEGSIAFACGKTFHINCTSSSNRENLAVKISSDNFKTYEEIVVDELGGYSDIAILNGKIFVFYEKNIKVDGLYFKKIDYNL